MNKKVINYIEKLENESFRGWSDDAKNGYLTACFSIKVVLNNIDKIGPICPYDGNCDVSTKIDGIIYCERMVGVCNG